MEVDETAEEAALREAEEEVGLSLTLGPLLGVYSRPSARGGQTAARPGGPVPSEGPGVLVVVFRARVGRAVPKPGRECLEAAWFRPEEIPWEGLAFETTHWALRDWLALKERRRRSRA
jgi:ADP-ribose pyrophosphatase YjhB (NUDIX family)